MSVRGPLQEAADEWRERAERAEARVAELEDAVAAAHHAERVVLKIAAADRDAALDLLRRAFGHTTTDWEAWEAEGRALLARVDSGEPAK